MPFGDRTGPVGLGPMTGRGAGFCAGYSVPGFMNPIPASGAWGWGRGRGGWGRGFGFGRGRWYGAAMYGGSAAFGAQYASSYAYGAPIVPPYAPLSGEQEKEVLKSQMESFEKTLEGIRKRIAELEAEQAGKK